MGLIAGLVVGGILTASVLSALVWRIGSQSQQPRIIANAAAPEVDTQWKAVSFRSGGSQMKGWLLEPSQGSATQEEGWLFETAQDSAAEEEGLLPLVVVAHGWGSNRTRVLRYTHPLYKAGFAVFMYDARNHGESDTIKAPSALMFRDDVIAAVDAARRLPGIDPDRVSVLGHSLGGFGALLALDQGMRVCSVITDSMPVRFETMMEAELKRKKIPSFPLAYLIPPIWLIRSGISQAQFRAANIPDVLARHAGLEGNARTPVLMIHSSEDDFIPAADLRQLKEQLSAGTIETLFVSTKGHSSSEQDPAFWDRVLPFLEETLLKEA
ncbi:alpha/beta fold hydrolase [Paenibacillus alkaliterrae]|uniref:alpha/beta hydrolase n=1 Tax=Paenibacillus alkaliterrae TaxID=320909 RepID=UPI001F3EF988|nr:alpha/beta fold hydrolase [Paenibacillus alkaliterrae]MCF2937742.1 alpha/beta fold hydrolase [Paenibacillus alkaliterrae]